MAKGTRQPNPELENESKSDRFKRLMNARLKKWAHFTSLIGNLSGARYEYSPEDVEAVRAFMKGQVDAALKPFERGGSKQEFTPIV